MKKFLIIGLVGIVCGIGVVSCGSDAPFDAKLNAPADVDWGTLASGLNYFANGSLLYTLTNSDGSKPVPGASIRISAGDVLVGSFALLCGVPWDTALVTCSRPVGGAPSLKMTTDNNGTARVYLLVHTTDCTGTSGTVSGDTSLVAEISAVQTVTEVKYTVDC